MSKYPKGRLIPEAVHQRLREKFAYITHDHHGQERLFLDNSGGSFRLKAATDSLREIDLIPDCPERTHANAQELIGIIRKGEESIAKIFGATKGSYFLRYTASLCNAELIDIAAQYLPGKNIVTTVLEHPSMYDAFVVAAEKYNKELRIVPADPLSGEIKPEKIAEMVDQDTAFVNLIYASNITGAILDLETIMPKLREIKPDLYIISDAVQHAPHHSVNFEKVGLDAATVALYKMFGPRGIGIGWVSERFAKLPHRKLLGKPQSEWSLGSPAPGFFQAITEVVEYIEWLGREAGSEFTAENDFDRGMDAIFYHEKALLHFLLEGDQQQKGLRAIPNLDVHFLDEGIEGKDCIIGISIPGEAPNETTQRFAQENVLVYERVVESIYSKRMIEALELTGVVRVSPLHVQTIDEMRKFLAISEKLASQ